MDVKLLAQYGIDYNQGVARCMGDGELYEKLLDMFLEDDCFSRAKAAHEGGDQVALFRCAHEMKGVCGNAAVTDLYTAVCPLVELLRKGGAEPAEVDRLFSQMEAAYLRAREGVSLALGK